MADSDISSLTELAGANVVQGDWMVIDDVSTSTTKKLDPVELVDVPLLAASTSQKGFAEAATAVEVNTGTDAARYVSPDALAGSIFGQEGVTVPVIPAATSVTTGDGKAYFRLPDHVAGMNLIGCAASVFAKSTSGNPTIQIARGRQSSATSAHTYVDMLSTRITIDANDFDSKDAAAAAVIDASNDDIAVGDMIRIDVDTAGTGTTGLFVTLRFQLP